MWIFSTKGFFSIVMHDDENQMLIRARKESDLTNLIDACPVLAGKQPFTLKHRDYAWRIIVSAEVIGEVMAVLGDTINYHNFKGAMGNIPDQRDKLPLLHNVWDECYQYQEDLTDLKNAKGIHTGRRR